MLLSFKVKNFRSFKDEQGISFVLEKDERIERVRRFEVKTKNGNLRILKNAIIYGANASGKTNILLALRTLNHIIMHQTLSDNSGLFVDTFAYNKDNTRFEVKFLREDAIFEYHLEYKHEEVVWESLYKDDTIVFERNHQAFTFPNLDDAVKSLLKTVRKTGLLIFFAQSYNVEEAKDAFSWFYDSFYAAGTNMIKALKTDKDFKEKILYALQFADFNILDIEVEERQPISSIDEREIMLLENAVKLAEGRERYERIERSLLERINNELTKIYFIHENNGIKYRIPLQNESEGTKAYFETILLLLNPNKASRTFLFRDELDLSLHKGLTYNLVEFLNSEKNAIQFISTSHDSSLMNLLSKHQIYFVQKNTSGESEIFKLSDFNDIGKTRSDTKYAPKYEAGLFGAEPIINDAGLMSIFGASHE